MIGKIYLDKLLSTFIGLIFALILVPSNIKSIVILFLGVTLIINWYKKKTKFNWSLFLNFGFIYILILLTLFFSKDLNQGLMSIQTMLSLLIFPLYFSLITKEEYKTLNLNLYVWVYLVSIFIFHFTIFFWFFITKFSFNDTLIHFQEIVTIHIGKLNTHPIYISMHCSVALLFSFFINRNKMSNLKRVVLFFLQSSMVLFLVLHAKKGPILAFIFTILVYLLISNKKTLKVYGPIIIGVIVLFISIPKVKNRFLEIFTIQKLTESNQNSTNIRVAIYENSINLIKQSPLFGYGIGDYNTELRKSFIVNNQTFLLDKEYNTHNQFLSFMMIGGPLILFGYFYFFIKNVRLSYLRGNKIFILVLIFYSTVMLTENILERENGVIFFSFFISLFGFNNYNNIEKE